MKKNLKDFLLLNYPDEEFLMADDFDESFIGINRGFNGGQLVYDREKCIKILMKTSKMDYEEAMEYFEYNVSGAYVGENTPIFVQLEKL